MQNINEHARKAKNRPNKFNFLEQFRENHRTLSVFAKIFAKIIHFWESRQYFQAASRICSRRPHIFAKTNSFAKIFELRLFQPV
jgi:hypothetical protein